MRHFYVSWAIGVHYGHDEVILQDKQKVNRETISRYLKNNTSHYNYYVTPFEEPEIMAWSLIE